MAPAPCASTMPIPPPAYHRAQAKMGPALRIDAITLVRCLHLLALCHLAVWLARRRCPLPLPAGLGGRPRWYREESLLLLALLCTLWRLSYQDLHDWLVAWPVLALACGLPTDAHGRPQVPSAAQHCAQAGAPVCKMLLVVVVHLARQTNVISERDLVPLQRREVRLVQADSKHTVHRVEVGVGKPKRSIQRKPWQFDE